MKVRYYDEKTGKYDLMRQLQDMADARTRNPDHKPPKMYWNYTQQKCYEQAAIIPPLKVFLGWTPMKEFISKCKPFVKTRSVLPHVMGIGISVMSIEAKNSDLFPHYKLIMDSLGIPKGKEGDENV